MAVPCWGCGATVHMGMVRASVCGKVGRCCSRLRSSDHRAGGRAKAHRLRAQYGRAGGAPLCRPPSPPPRALKVGRLQPEPPAPAVASSLPQLSVNPAAPGLVWHRHPPHCPPPQLELPRPPPPNGATAAGRGRPAGARTPPGLAGACGVRGATRPRRAYAARAGGRIDTSTHHAAGRWTAGAADARGGTAGASAGRSNCCSWARTFPPAGAHSRSRIFQGPPPTYTPHTSVLDYKQS